MQREASVPHHVLLWNGFSHLDKLCGCWTTLICHLHSLHLFQSLQLFLHLQRTKIKQLSSVQLTCPLHSSRGRTKNSVHPSMQNHLGALKRYA